MSKSIIRSCIATLLLIGLPAAYLRAETSPRNPDAQPDISTLRISAVPGETAARQWKTRHPGSVRLAGWLRKIPADAEARVIITAEGKGVWSCDLSTGDGIRHGFDVACLDLASGSEIGIKVVAPREKVTVETEFELLDEPYLSRWNAALPDAYPKWTGPEKLALRERGRSILRTIREASAAKRGKVVVPPGDYLFHADWSRESTLAGLTDLEIVADGATFWFEPPLVHALLFENCRNVKTVGLTIDCTIPCWFQAQVTSVDHEAGTITATVMPGYEPRSPDGKPESTGNRALMFYDPAGGFINHRHSPGEWSLDADGKTIRIGKIGRSGIPSKLKSGDYVVGTLRTGAALRSIGCGGMCFRNVNIWSSPGMAVYEGGGKGGTIYHTVRATRRPHTNRLHAFGADIFHLAGTDRGPVLDRCELAYGADDNLNIHGQFGRVVARETGNRYFLEGSYATGDVVEFRHERTLELLGKSKVISVSPAPDGPSLPLGDKYRAKGENLVELEPAPDLPPLTLVVMDGKRSAAGFVVRGCWLHDNFQRTLINGSPGGLIENNTLQNTGEGLTIQFETWGPWMEGPFARDLTIRGNRFLASPPDAATIRVSMHPPGGGSDGKRFAATPVTNLTITDNRFGRTTTAPLLIHNVAGLRIAANSIDYPANAPPHRGLVNGSTESWLYLQDCDDVSLENNETPGGHGNPAAGRGQK